MATFFVYDITWDIPADVIPLEDMPTYTCVWLPGYNTNKTAVEDDADAVLDKLADDFGFEVKDYGMMMTVEAVDQEDTSNHPCRAHPQS